MTTTTTNFLGNSKAILNYSKWARTKEQIVQEFFGLRKEVVYDDEWVNIIDMINDFRDLDTLKIKKVAYNTKLQELGVSETDFNALFNKWLPTLEVKEETNGKQSNSWKSTKAKAK